MISKSLLKLIHSLEIKKYRRDTGLFVAEGGKCVGDIINSGIACEKIIATDKWLSENSLKTSAEIIAVSDEDLQKASFLRAPQGVIGLFKQPEHTINPSIAERELCLALDEVQDPGNLGTIIRIADWFGIENIFCSQNTADIYNPKTVQSTMGAIGRVKVHYVDLAAFLSPLKGKAPIYGTFLDGENIYDKELSSNGIIIMGNEGNGIGEKCAQCVNERLFIPNFPIGRPTSESLNVSTATAIVCAEFRRRK